GPLVLAVCQRIAGNAADADDAFQATFLALARQASSLRRPEHLAAWLHGVARRIALKARQAGTRQREQGHDRPRSIPPSPLEELTVRELLEVLDEEIERLPVAYRQPIILCYLEERTLE